MPRKARFILPHIPHHTIQRGNNRQNIFFEHEDFDYFLKKLKQFSLENGVQIGSYCLMTNHIHLLTYPDTAAGMIKCMKLICQHYTQYVNRKYKRTGKLWENRYKSHWVDPESEWILARYIEKNPLRAGMVRRAEDYSYSSARRNLWGNKDGLISREIVTEPRRPGYRKFFHEDDFKEKQLTQDINLRVEQGKAFGSESFIMKLSDLLGISAAYRKRGRPKKKQTVFFEPQKFQNGLKMQV